MRTALSFATLLLLTPLGPAVAQSWMTPRSTDAATRNWEKAPVATIAKKNAKSKDDDEGAGAEARARNEARERAWDTKTKRTMRSICSGAAGC
jgi:hypothetical protein